MRRVFLAAVVTLVPLLGMGQSATGTPKVKPISPFAVYAGEWTATFNGGVWMRLRLKMNGEQLVGSMVRARKVDLNDNGELKSVSDEQATDALVTAEVNPDGLLLKVSDTESQETGRYMMKLLPPANDTADLKMIAMQMPPGMPKPKPWRLVRSGQAAPSGPATPKQPIL